MRTHLAGEDLAWVPRSFKWAGSAAAGAVWASLGGAYVAAAVAGAPWLIFHGLKLIPLTAGAGYALGRAASGALVRARLAKLARGHVELVGLRSTRDGALVHVRGRVRAAGSIRSLVTGERCVARRATFRVPVRLNRLDGAVIHEAAVDFMLVPDEDIEPIRVDVRDARIVARVPPKAPHESWHGALARVLELDLDAGVRAALTFSGGVAPVVREVVLRDGDHVEIVGRKARVVDVAVRERLAREAPMRTVLESSPELPLLIGVR